MTLEEKKAADPSYCPTNVELMGIPKNGVSYSYEECYPHINSAIMARKPRWLLQRLAWLEYEDVAQIIRIHIYVKFYQWDQLRPILKWVNRIISNQTANIVRNTYTSYVKPCNGCAANEDGTLCRIYVNQCSDCPLYAKWEKSKKNAHEINLAESYNELESWHKNLASTSCNDIYQKIERVHIETMKRLTLPQQRIYRYIYIDHMNELDVAKIMGYKTSEKFRSPGYKQIEKCKKLFLKMAKEAIKESVDL